MLESIYRELILDHYRKPRNKGAMPEPTVTVSMRNPMCGDEVDLMLAVEEDRIADARFVGQGCSISQASVSMMTETIKGKTLDEALDLEGRFLALMRGEEESKRDKRLGDLRALEGVAKLPVRIKCALLGWNALDEAVKAYRKSDRGLMGKTLEFEDLTTLPAGFDPAEHKDDLPS
ncbi:MAG TPA: SUF system NifU family Fe-S cluster assembly protein [Gemmatimonadota bacterium]|nr:SUF system NifU family Fe-S cluster assembly protein [Gemmatimonadota bacterium]